MVSRMEAYFLFFRAVQGLEDVMDYVETVTDQWTCEICTFRSKLDAAVEEMLQMSVDRDWRYAFNNSRFSEFWYEYETFADKNFRPYFQDGSFKFS